MTIEIREILNLVPNDPDQIRMTIDIIETYCKLSWSSGACADYHAPSMRAVYEMLSMGESPLAIQEICRASGNAVDASKALKVLAHRRLKDDHRDLMDALAEDPETVLAEYKKALKWYDEWYG